jgi:hypothetical protein
MLSIPTGPETRTIHDNRTVVTAGPPFAQSPLAQEKPRGFLGSEGRPEIRNQHV